MATINDATAKSIPDKTDFVPLWDTAAAQQKKTPLLGLTNPGSIIHPGFKAGIWYIPHYYGDNYNSVVFGANLLHLCPFLCPREALFTDIAINVITAVTGGLARLGIFELKTDLSLDKILAQGEVATTTTGLKISNIALATPLLGWYGLAVAVNANSTLSANSSQLNKGFMHGVGTPPSTNIYSSRSAPFTYASGAFTDNPALTFTDSVNNPIGVWLKAV